MPDYFLVHDPAVLGQLRSALALAWRQRDFAACAGLCRDWTGAAREYARLYQIHFDETVLAHVEGLPFDRALWRTLAGELLLFAARETPDLPLPASTLMVLLTSGRRPERPASRADFQPIHRALHGTRDLTLGPVVYRPDNAGLNDPKDVAELALALGAVRPESWTPSDLVGLPDLDEADRGEELELAREWFAVLVDLYAATARRSFALVVEQMF